LRVLRLSTTLSTTATGGSARMLIDGTTISKRSLPPSSRASSASFSHASSTSPCPRSTNVVVAPRAPVSSTGTFFSSRATKSCALSSPPYFFAA